MYALTRALVMYCTPSLYCVYALVGRAISIRDPYICAVHQCGPTNHMLSSNARCLCSENVAIGFKTSIEAYFVGKTAIGCRSCSRLANYAITFEQNGFTKIAFKKNRFCIAMNLLVSFFCDSNM